MKIVQVTHRFAHMRSIQTIFLIVGLSLIYALCSQITLWLPFGLVPISLQPLPLYIAVLCFRRLAIYAYLLYLVEGACGAPFFAGGLSGIGRLCGPTGGYLCGFLVAMCLLEHFYQRISEQHRSFLMHVRCLMGAQIIVFICGLGQLSFFVPVKKLFVVGLYPFLFGDFLLKPICYFLSTKVIQRNAE